jgi:hypothetical protein
MIRIKSHNVLNGMRFSIAEFLFIVPFATYYLAHYRLAYGFVSFGVLANCVVVVVFGLRQLAQGDKDDGPQQLLNKQKRIVGVTMSIINGRKKAGKPTGVGSCSRDAESRRRQQMPCWNEPAHDHRVVCAGA